LGPLIDSYQPIIQPISLIAQQQIARKNAISEPIKTDCFDNWPVTDCGYWLARWQGASRGVEELRERIEL
jgi:hypothetical protein